MYTSPLLRFELTTSVVIGTDCMDSCKFNSHAITATTVPQLYGLGIVEKKSDVPKSVETYVK